MAGAMIWMIVTLATGFVLQALAIVIGASCGFAMGHYGRIVDRRYARMSAYFCILACVCGELLVAYTLHVEIGLLYTPKSVTLLAVFLLEPRTRVFAAWGIIALLIAVFPANLYAAFENIGPEGPGSGAGAAAYVRLPLQALFIVWAWWYTRPDGDTSV